MLSTLASLINTRIHIHTNLWAVESYSLIGCTLEMEAQDCHPFCLLCTPLIKYESLFENGYTNIFSYSGTRWMIDVLRPRLCTW